jgi:hypothetical protein
MLSVIIPYTEEELAAERWRPVVGFPFYEVSDLGRLVQLKPNGSRRMFRCLPNKLGYVRVQLFHPAQRIFVHRLVLEAFVGPFPKGYVTNHKDGNCANNRLGNLEQVTHRENVIHAVETGLLPKPVGEGNPRAKLTRANVDVIRQELEKGIRGSTLAAQYGVTPSTIRWIERGVTWQ